MKSRLNRILVVFAMLSVMILQLDAQENKAAPAMKPQPEIKAPAATSTPALTVKARPLDTLVSSSKFGNMTLKELKGYAGFVRDASQAAGVPIGSLERAASDNLKNVARLVTACQAAEKKFDASADAETTQALNHAFEAQRGNLIAMEILRGEIDDQITTPSAEVIHSYYRQHEPQFVQPFQFTMRHLLLSTYEPYTVQNGDTLEGIAEKISGNPKMADNIRADVPARPLRREGGKQYKPLIPGEDKLLVPISESKAAQAQQKLQEILKQLDTNKTFEELAREYSDAENKGSIVGPYPSGTRPMLKEIIEMGRETPQGAVSPIFRTKHGYNAIQVVTKDEAGTRSLQSATPDIIKVLRAAQRVDLEKKLINNLFSQPGVVVHYDRLAKNDSLTTDTVVGEAGPTIIRWQDIQEAWTRGNRPESPERLKTFVERNEQFIKAAMLLYVKDSLNDPAKGMAQRVAAMRTGMIGSNYLVLQANKRVEKQITPDMIRQHYAASKDQKYRKTEEYAYTSMVMSLTDAEKELDEQGQRQALQSKVEAMKNTLAEVKNIEDFRNQSAMVNEPLVTAGQVPPHSDQLVPLHSIQPPYTGLLKGLKEGQWSEPAISGQLVISVAAVKYADAGYQPLDAQLAIAIKREIGQGFFSNEYQQLIDEFNREAGFEFRLK